MENNLEELQNKILLQASSIRKEILSEYPFLRARNRVTDELLPQDDNSCADFDEMPLGWIIAFGEDICKELKEALIKINFLDDYRIFQIKEKFGSLRWYDNCADESVIKIIDKYTERSQHTCILCGSDAFEWFSFTGLCGKCTYLIAKNAVKPNE